MKYIFNLYYKDKMEMLQKLMRNPYLKYKIYGRYNNVFGRR